MDNIKTPTTSTMEGENSKLAAEITKAGSKQTYYTFLLLADRDRVQDAYRAYAYFRWLDDLLDCDSGTKEDRSVLISRQQTLLECGYKGEDPGEASREERMLLDLISNDDGEHSGLQIYLRNMMAVMSFDVERRGKLISHAELKEYTHLLASAVTELLFYLIGHHNPPPCGEHRYHAVYGAHVVHMLRDMVEDISSGYYNIPCEAIKADGIRFDEVNSPVFQKWVYGRVKLAREYFRTGRKYIARVQNLRCRMAGFAYLARFEWMLKLIEEDGYCLRLEYPERKSLKAMLWMVWRVLTSTLHMAGTGREYTRWTTPGGQCEER